MPTRVSQGAVFQWVVIVLALVAAVGCASQQPATPQLRVENVGQVDLTSLVVLFPGETAMSEARRVVIGDVAAGVVSSYVDAPAGVYRYAAYEYILNGKTVNQFVIDWVGEEPVVGSQFTYRLRLDPTKVQGDQVELVAVNVDRH